ncbi:VP6 [Reovirus GCRV104]|nr:VP6 [Reovirus GCRV104]
MARVVYVFYGSQWFTLQNPAFNVDDVSVISTSGAGIWGKLAEVNAIDGVRQTTGNDRSPLFISRLLKLGQLATVWLPSLSRALQFRFEQYHGAILRSPAIDALVLVPRARVPPAVVPAEAGLYDLMNFPRFTELPGQMWEMVLDSCGITMDAMAVQSMPLYIGFENQAPVADLMSQMPTFVGRSITSIAAILYSQSRNSSGVPDPLIGRTARLLSTITLLSFTGHMHNDATYYGFYVSRPRETKSVEGAILMYQQGANIIPLTNANPNGAYTAVGIGDPLWQISPDLYAMFLLNIVYAANCVTPVLDTTHLAPMRTWAVAGGMNMYRLNWRDALRRKIRVDRQRGIITQPEENDCLQAVDDYARDCAALLDDVLARQTAFNRANPGGETMRVKPFAQADYRNPFEFVPAMISLTRVIT